MKLIHKLKIPFVIITFGLIVSLLGRKLKITEINCKSLFGVCEDKITEKFSQIEGLSYIQAKKSVNEILESEVAVKSYLVHFSLPSKLEVTVLESKPKYALQTLASDTFSLISEDGKVLTEVDSSNLPKLRSDSNSLLEKGHKLDVQTLFALDLVSSISNSQKLSRASLEADKLIVVLDQGERVIFPIEGDKELLLGSFFLIVNELKSNDFASTMKKSDDYTIDL